MLRRVVFSEKRRVFRLFSEKIASGSVESVSVKEIPQSAPEKSAHLDTASAHAAVFSSEPAVEAARAHAELAIESPGMAAVVRARVPPGGGVRCVVGSLVGLSSGATLARVLAAGAGGTLARVAAGGGAYLHEVTVPENGPPATALIAPASLGDVCIVRLTPGFPLHLRVGAVLAVTEQVRLSTGASAHPLLAGGGGLGSPPPSLAAGPFAHFRNLLSRLASRAAFAAVAATHFGKTRMVTIVDGRGDVAVTSFGAIFRVSLESSADRYSVNPEHVIGWHGSIREIGRGIENDAGGDAGARFWRGGEGSHLVTVSGPGDLYLQTRGERKTRAQRMREERMEMEVLEDEIERKALERARD